MERCCRIWKEGTAQGSSLQARYLCSIRTFDFSKFSYSIIEFLCSKFSIPILKITSTSFGSSTICSCNYSHFQVCAQFWRFPYWFSILDIEIIYAIKGKMISPMMPPVPNQRCEFQWNSSETKDASQEKIESFLKGISFSVRVTISALTGEVA